MDLLVVNGRRRRIRLSHVGRAKELTKKLDVPNIFDASDIGLMGTRGFTVSGDKTLEAGARRLVFLSLGTTF